MTQHLISLGVPSTVIDPRVVPARSEKTKAAASSHRSHPEWYPVLPDTMHLFISFKTSTSSQKRQLNILMSNSKHQVDDFVVFLTF